MNTIRRCRYWYGKLLRLYPTTYYERFGQSMEQTFSDLCRERMEAQRGLGVLILWVFIETTGNIIKENMIVMKNKRLYLILIGIAGILLVPFLAGAPWDEIDYIAAGILLLGAGLGFELVMRKVSSPGYRAAIIVALLAALFLIYAELAVGILGTPFAGS